MTVADIELCEKWLSEHMQTANPNEADPSHEDLGVRVALTMMGPRKSPFKTGKGYMGYGPRWVRPNDVIAAVHGARTPVAFRPNQPPTASPGEWTVYELVGPCDVHGLVKERDYAAEPGKRVWIC